MAVGRTDAQPFLEVCPRMNPDVFPTFTDDPRQRRQPPTNPVFAFTDPGGELRRRQEVVKVDDTGPEKVFCTPSRSRVVISGLSSKWSR